MITSKLTNLNKSLYEGKDTSAIELDFYEVIDDLPKQSKFAEICVSCAFRLCSGVPIMKVETEKSIILQFFPKYGPESLLLISSINCFIIGTRNHCILEPLIIFSLLREAIDVVKAGGLDVSREHEAGQLKARIASIEAQLAKAASAPALLENSEVKPSPALAKRMMPPSLAGTSPMLHRTAASTALHSFSPKTRLSPRREIRLIIFELRSDTVMTRNFSIPIPIPENG
jgi:hypothetical protein